MPTVTPSLGLLGIILFLLPGLMGIRAYFSISKKADPLSRTETVAWSFLLSLYAMAIIYIGYSFGFGQPATVALLTPHVDTLPDILSHYFVVFLTSVATGAIYGLIIEQDLDDVRSRRDLWEYYMDDVIEETDNYIVRVVTSEGERVSGILTKYGSSAQKRDIMLRKPKTEIIGQSERKIEIENWTGQVYLQGDDIKQVHFDSLWDADRIQIKEEDEINEEQQKAQNEAMVRLEELAEESTESKEEKQSEMD